MSDLQNAENPMFPVFHKNESMKRVKFEKPVDGDTAYFIFMDHNKEMKVRFFCIDTPEIYQPVCDKQGNDSFDKKGYNERRYHPKEGAVEALEYVTKRLSEAKEIYLEPDSTGDKTDKYGRHLYWVWVDGSLLEAELVQYGYAQVKFTEVQDDEKEEENTQPEYKYVKQLKNIEAHRNTCPMTSENYLIKIPNANYIRNLGQEDLKTLYSHISEKPNLQSFKNCQYDVAVEVLVVTNYANPTVVTIYTDESMIQKDKDNNLFLAVPITASMPAQYKGKINEIPLSGATLINQSDDYHRRIEKRADLCAVPSELIKTEPCINTSFGRLKYINQEQGFGYILWNNSENDSEKKEINFSRFGIKDANLFNNMKPGDTLTFEQTDDNGRIHIKSQSITIVPSEVSEVKMKLKQTRVKPINQTKQSGQNIDTDVRESYEISNVPLMKDSPNASSVISGTIRIDGHDLKKDGSSENTDIITICPTHNYDIRYAYNKNYIKVSGDQLIKELTDGANMLKYHNDKRKAGLNRSLPQGYENIEPDEIPGIHIQTETKSDNEDENQK